MYQLSRLLHDYHRELYNHFEEHEICPSLYAAPWFLTLFASQFPLSFVSRIFGIYKYIFFHGCLFFYTKPLIVMVLFYQINANVFNRLCLFFACAVFVSDFIFVQGTAVIFKVALCLLSSHEGEIVECDSFETIVDYLKTALPALSQTQMEQTIAKVQTGG